jgi:hypothetical protein
MSEQVAATEEQGSGADVLENPDRWIAERVEKLRADAPPAPEPEAEPPAAEVAQAPPEAPQTGAWREAVLDDVDHGFFKGRKAGDLYESYRSAESAMQKAQREAAEYRAQLEQVRQQQTQRPQEAIPNPENDPRLKEVNDLWYVDPARAAALQREIAREDAAREAERTFYRISQERDWQVTRQTAAQASVQAMQAIANAYGISEEEAAERVQATWPTLKRYEADPQYGVAVWTRTENYLNVAQRLFGAPPQREAAPAPSVPEPEIPNPPGSRRPAAVASPPSRTANPLSQELTEVYRTIASAGGLDPDSLIKRAQKRRASG